MSSFYEITRREFVQQSAQSLAAMQAALIKPPAAPPQTSPATEKQTPPPDPVLPPDKRIGFAVVGLGKLSLKEILPAFGRCKKAKVTALVSGDRAKAETVGRQYGVPAKNLYNYQTYDQLRDNPDVDVIYIVLPNGMHAEYTVRGAQAGKHILCEKPMANTVKECQSMIDACAKAGRKLMIAYRMQYEPYNRAMINLVRSQEFGPTKFIVADNGQNMGDPNQWRLKKSLAGGGALPDVGIYCLNATRYLTGEEPTEILAHQYSTPNDPRFREVEESVSFTLRYPSGVIANCSTSYGYHEARRYRVFAAGGWAELDPAFSYTGLRMRVGHKQNNMDVIEERRLDDKDQFATEMDHMAECALENKTPLTPGEEGLQDIRLIAAIYEAARTGRPVRMRENNASLDRTRNPAAIANF